MTIGDWIASLAIGSCAAAGFYVTYRAPLVQAIRVIDGDTLEISGERIRLNGIDAPEMAGHCRRGRTCVPGDPLAARDELAAGVDLPGEIFVRRLKRDRYGRTVAQVTIGGVDLSCRQISLGAARYIGKWDEGHIMEGSCE